MFKKWVIALGEIAMMEGHPVTPWSLFMSVRAVAMTLLATSLTSCFAAEGNRPNLILIMCDDMGFSDIGCYGGEVQTPHLDRLAREGMRFTQFYNNAKCTTTRATLVTGLYPRFGQQGFDPKLGKQHLRRNMLTLGEALADVGYLTALCGKWHLGRSEDTHPYHRGFQHFYGLLDGCCNFFDPSRPDPRYKGGRVRVFGYNDQRLDDFPEDFYTTDAFTDAAIKTIHAATEKQQPFFVHLTYTAPHYPLHAKPADIAKYRGKFMMGWDAMRKQRWDRLQELGLTNSAWTLADGDSRAYDWKTANHAFEDHRMAVYAAMIDSMDQNIGRVLQTLQETGHDRDTLILFFSDNGGCAEEPGGREPSERNPGPKDDYVAVGPSWGWAQNAPFRRYKSWLHEGGITTPCIAWWPEQVPANAINRDVAHIIDVMPTFLELVGTMYPDQHGGHSLLPLEGVSMVPLLRGEQRSGTRELAWYWAGNRALRQGDWKLVWDKQGKTRTWELYDLSVDRCEVNDLASKHPDRVASMSAAWHQWADEMELKMARPEGK